jgi:ubiquinone/menaquinone biosynthesis C-methylase UbiE
MESVLPYRGDICTAYRNLPFQEMYANPSPQGIEVSEYRRRALTFCLQEGKASHKVLLTKIAMGFKQITSLKPHGLFTTVIHQELERICNSPLDATEEMGVIFDKSIADAYEAWTLSPEGRVIERTVEEFIIELLDPRPGERVLDIGCGSGTHLLTLNKLGLDVSGVDASPYMIHQARERLGNRSALKVGRAEDLPYDDNEFDLAVLINALEFLDDPLQALKEAGRVANRRVFVGVINSLSWNGFHKRIQGYLGNPLFSRAKFYSLWKLKFLLQAAHGPVPLSWRCTRILPWIPFSKDANSRLSPFGTFLGISAALRYRIRTDNMYLKVGLNRMRQPAIDGNRREGILHPHIH